MPNYDVVKYSVEPVEGDDQVAVTIHASDGNKWEYGIPYNRASGRYQFPEIDVLEMDFGEDFARELIEKVEALVERLCK
ncbi:MAG: hypothetical protein HUU28_17295 [Planctomycetaceae bacterium]|jgi:hypothetical protein|nr:hypothetical protein [Planctomycetaceae bacterium]